MNRVWGNPNRVGMVYEVLDTHSSHVEHRIQRGDIVLCLEHTGDCHYTWVLLKESKGNAWKRYFNIEKLYSSYGIQGAELQLLSEQEMISALVSMSFDSRSAVLIDRPKEETKKLLAVPCPLCGEVRK